MMNRRERRRRGVEKDSMNEVEFKAFLKIEDEKREAAMRPSRIAQAVRFAVKYPERRPT